MKKTNIKNKKMIGGIAAIISVAVVSCVAFVGMTFANYSMKAPIKMNAEDAMLQGTVYWTTSDAEAEIVGSNDQISDFTSGLSWTSAESDYTTTGITVTNGTTPFGNDAERFKLFAPGQLRAVGYKIVNTGNIDMVLTEQMVSEYAAPSDAKYDWDEQDPRDSIKTKMYASVNGAPWSALDSGEVALSTCSTTKDVGGSITLKPNDYVEIIQLVEFTNGAEPADNYSGDNAFMNAKFNWTLFFNCEQPANPGVGNP